MPTLERFCRYVSFDTQAVEDASAYPSSAGQVELNRFLERELREMGCRDVLLDEHGILTATVPGNRAGIPVMAWVAHVDTSPETSGKDVKPVVHEAYPGGTIVLPGDPSRRLCPEQCPDLDGVVGKTLVTSDGTTLLGADDKAGVTAVVEAAERLLKNPDLPRGDVRLCFTCDEEVGNGVRHLSLERVGARVAYTVDGEGQGTVDTETFSADLALVRVRGVNTHPSRGKGKMVNAVRIAAELISRLPRARLAPETSGGREGFLHPYRIEGGVAEATVRIILRSFETDELAAHARLLGQIAEGLRAEHPEAVVEVDIRRQYRNMRDGLKSEPRAVAYAVEAMRRVGLDPRQTIIRGGTDGSNLTSMGLPCPNLASGQHNMHSPLEWTCLEEMEKTVEVLLALAAVWAEGPPAESIAPAPLVIA